MPILIASIAGVGALAWLTDETGDAVEKAGDAGLKLAFAGALAAGAYYLYRRAR